MRKFVLLMSAVLFCALSAMGQTQRVTGKVTSPDGQPLPGVTVTTTVNGTLTGVATSTDGSYSLNADRNGTLTFSFLGYESQTIEVGGRTQINIMMQEDAQRIDDVMVVAYGTARKESYTGSAGVISSKELEKRTVSNVTKALEGTVSGLQVTSGSGQPGQGSTLRVRGIGSINSSNDPLIVVDGAAYDGRIENLNPDDIASVTVLKDAAAGALYGARGANGVIMINTKRGMNTDGRVRVSLKANVGIVSRAVPRYDMLDEKDWIEQNFLINKNSFIYDDGMNPQAAGIAAKQQLISGVNRIFGNQQQYNPYNVSLDDLIDPVTGKVDPNAQLLWSDDWLDAAMRDTPVRQDYNLTVQGGNERTQYYISAGYLNEQGLMKTTSFDRTSGRVRVDTKARDWLSFSGDLNYALSNTSNQTATGSTSSNVWSSSAGIGPIYPLYEMIREGNSVTYVLDDEGNRVYDWGKDRPIGASQNFNATGLLLQDKYYSKTDAVGVTGNVGIKFDDSRYGWAEGFFANVMFTTNIRNNRQTTYYNPYVGNADGEISGRLYKYSMRDFSYTFNQMVGYTRTFGDHNIFVQGGHEFYNLTYNNLHAHKTGFPYGGIYELGPGVNFGSMDSYEHNYAIQSVLGQAKYSYLDRYFLDVSYRTDGSSRFHKDHRWGNFWSVGGNWRISEENFMRSVNWMDNLSLRASYGVQGNDALQYVSGGAIYNNYYVWQAFYDITSPNATNGGAVLSSLPNPEITWEKNANFNVGIETRLFGRLNLTAEYYIKKTSDLLMEFPMASSTGFNYYNANIGDMRNEGFEFELGVDIFQNPNFRWRFTAIGSTLKNKILKLASDTPIIDGNQVLKVGESIFSYYLPESAGVDPATGKKLYWVWDQRDPITDEPTSEPYISDDVSLASTSRKIRGTTLPDFYGSIGSNFTIMKNLDFSFLTTYSIGGVRHDGEYWTYRNPLNPGAGMSSHVLRAWQQPGDVTDIPRVEFANSPRLTGNDLINASYFSIANITIGYTFRGPWADRAGIESIRLYATADNVKTFTHLKGFDPRSRVDGVSTFSYTPIRTVSLGVNVNF